MALVARNEDKMRRIAQEIGKVQVPLTIFLGYAIVFNEVARVFHHGLDSIRVWMI